MAATIDLEHNTAIKAVKAPAWPLYSWSEKSPNARLVYTRDADEANVEIAKLRPGPLGLDMEWKPSFYVGERQNPVALIQLANDDVVLLLQVHAMSRFPERLREVLGSTLYVKAGVAIKGDCEKLYRDYQVPIRACVDLSLLARTVDNARWKGSYRQSIGLNRLCESYEELSLHKGKITRSNWELVLSEAQQDYAANDSHSGYTLFCRLAAMAAAMSPAPLPTWYTFDFVGRALDPETSLAWFPDNPNYDPGPPPPRVVREDGVPESERANRKNRRRKEDDAPHASNVSVVQSGPSSSHRIPHPHQPLWRPPPQVGSSRHVVPIASLDRHLDDVPLFVPRDSPDYHKYRSVREPTYDRREPAVQHGRHDAAWLSPLYARIDRAAQEAERTQADQQEPQTGYGLGRPDSPHLPHSRGEPHAPQAHFGLKQPSIQSTPYESGKWIAQPTEPGRGPERSSSPREQHDRGGPSVRRGTFGLRPSNPSRGQRSRWKPSLQHAQYGLAPSNSHDAPYAPRQPDVRTYMHTGSDTAGFSEDADKDADRRDRPRKPRSHRGKPPRGVTVTERV